jgi:hypothetical protein
VLKPLPMYHEEFITDEALEQMVSPYQRAKVWNSSSAQGIISAVMWQRPELRDAEIQVMRDEIRRGWKVRAKRGVPLT